jgi:MFS family permease
VGGEAPTGLSSERDARDGATAVEVAALQRRVLRTLLVSQTLGSVGISTGFAVAAIVAVSLAGSPATAGVATGIASIGTVGAAFSLAKITARSGRRPALASGYTAACAGAVLCGVAECYHSFVTFVVGASLFSVASATNFQARFAAADLSAPGRASRGISAVVWVSTIGAVVGPNTGALGDFLSSRTGLPGIALAYFVAGLGFALAATVVHVRLRPDPLLTARALTPVAVTAGPSQRRLRDGGRAIAGSGRAMLALACAVVAHAGMVTVMVWTPVHMSMGHQSTQVVIGFVMSGHLAGMYALSPAFGWLAARWGALRLVTAGSFVLVAALSLAASSSGTQHERLGIALFLLGIAWSQMFITGSAMLTESIDVPSRPAAQGVLDVAIWTVTGLTQTGAGWMIGAFGYPALCLLWLSFAAPLLLLCISFLVRETVVQPATHTT